MSDLPPKEIRPPRISPRLPGAPKIRQLYWCDFWNEAQLPEFWKRRPVVIVSFKHVLSGACTVIPTSSQPQPNNPWAFKLATTIDGSPSWAICNHPATVAISRLSPHKGPVPRLTQAEFDEVLTRLFGWLPKPPQSKA
jgi:mRNA interferase MazF